MLVIKWLLASLTVVQSLRLGQEDGYRHKPISGEDGIPMKGPRLNLTYIANHVSPVDLLCRGDAYGIILEITCPKIDGKTDNSIMKFGEIIEQATIKEQQKEDKHRYKNVNRTISWKAVGDKQNFSCICQGWKNFDLVATSNVVNVVKVPKIPKKKMIIKKRISPRRYVTLKCRVSASGRKLRVHWFKNGRRLKLSHHGMTLVNGVEYKRGKLWLKISTAAAGGSGNYTCFARNEAGKKFGPTYKVSIYAPNDFHNSTERRHDNATSEDKSGSSKNVCQSGFAGNDTVCPESTAPKSKSPSMNTIVTVIVVIGLIFVFPTLYFIGKHFCGKKNVMTNTAVTGHSDADDDDDISGQDTTATSSEVFSGIPKSAMKNSDFSCKRAKSTRLPKLGPNPRRILMSRSLPLLRESDALVQEISDCDSVEHLHSSFSFPSYSTDMLRRQSNKPKDADARYFASSIIGHEGGQITLNNIGIKLIIPEGALPEGRTENIYIALMGNDSDLPYLQENLSLISQVIMCGPPGLMFEKHVMLIFPHCATIENGISGFQILSSETKEDEETEWESIFDHDKDPSDDCFCSIDENVCFLSVSHFTKYAAVCECKGKMINIQAYSSKVIPPKEYCNIRVYCFPNSAPCRLLVQEDEKEINGTRCDAVRPLLFKEDGGGLCYTVKDINDEWKNIYENSQDIGYEEIWNCLSIPVSRTFTLKRKNPDAEMFSCRIDVVQKEKENPTICTINVAIPTRGTEQARRTPRVSTSSGSTSGYTSSVDVTNESHIPAELRTQLSHALDGEDRMDGKDWRMLAEKVNVEGSRIKWLAGNKRIDRPTEYILQDYEWRFSKESLKQKLSHLAEILDKMGRNDAAELIWKYLSNEDKWSLNETKI